MDWSFLRGKTTVFFLAKNITLFVLLQILEHLMEPLFTCPCNKFRLPFVGMYFCTPALAFIVFAVSLQQGRIFLDKICKCCCKKDPNPNPNPDPNSDPDSDSRCQHCSHSCMKKYGMTLYPALCWLVILLIDGKYLACGLYSNCNGTMVTANMTDPMMVENMAKSKVIGFGIVAGFVLIYLLYLCWERQCRSYEDRYEEMNMRKLEKRKERYAREYVKKCLDDRANECDQKLRRGPPETPKIEVLFGDKMHFSLGKQSEPSSINQSPSQSEAQSEPSSSGQSAAQSKAQSKPSSSGQSAAQSKAQSAELNKKTITDTIHQTFSFKK